MAKVNYYNSHAVNKIDYVKQGKANRAKGAAFELKTRRYFEGEGDYITKFQNNVDLDTGKFIAAKQKFIHGRGMGLGSGFPDFLVFRRGKVFFVECKCNGTLSKIEKLKCNEILKMGFEVNVAYLDEKEIKFREFLEYTERKSVHSEADEFKL